MLKNKKLNPINIFFIITGLLFVVAIIFAIIDNTTFYKNSVLDYTHPYMDFFNHIAYTRIPSKTYFTNANACFPPLIYIMFYVFSKMLPTQLLEFTTTSLTYEAMTLYIVFVAVLALAFGYCVKKYLNKYSDFVSFGVSFLCLVSSAFSLTAIDRGNTAILVLVILLIAIYCKSSNNKFLNELALILIAVAAGIKIYPAFFGLLYVVEGKKKETIRLIIYGILFFFVPFIFFGGFSGVKQFFLNQLSVQNSFSIGYMSINTISKNALINLGLGTQAADLFGKSFMVIFVIITLIALISKKDNWKKIFIITSVICFAPLWSGSYTVIYFIVPMLMMFAKTKDEYSKLDIIYSIGFALAFSLYTFSYKIGNDAIGNIIRLIPLHLMTISILVESYISMFKSKKNKKISKIQ